MGLVQHKMGMLNLSLSGLSRENSAYTPFWSLPVRQIGLFKGLVLTSFWGLRSLEHALTREDQPSLAHVTGALSSWEEVNI